MKPLRTALGPFALSTSIAFGLVLAACGGAGVSGSGSVGSNSGAGGDGGESKGDGGKDGSSGDGGDSTNVTVSVGTNTTSTTTGGSSCESGDDEDKDLDGFTRANGDCNDCDANVNPNAIEVAITEPDPETGLVPEAADEDCDGLVDNVPAASCDDGIQLASGNPLDGAHAIDLCHAAPATGGWGTISARWVKANGTELASPAYKAGILENFGPNVPPLNGARVFGISSGRARLPTQEGACGNVTCEDGGSGTAPAGFPAEVPGCNGGPGTDINDDIGLEVTLRAPSNATGYSFDFKFATFEYPIYVCSEFNDQFIALVNPAPPGSQNGNISFDSNNNPVSVNIGFFDVCSTCDNYASYCDDFEPGSNCPSAPNPCCAAGPGQIVGTGYDTWGDNGVAGGGTQWLRTTAPVQPGSEVTIRFAIWDAGDQQLDSMAVLDNFKWIANGGTVVEVGTVETPPDGPN